VFALAAGPPQREGGSAGDRPAGVPREAAREAGAAGQRAGAVAGIPGLRFEPTGLTLLRPFEKDKVPVVLVHGLWSGPWSWAKAVEELEADPTLSARYQFWTYGYSTGDPILYSSHLLRQNLRAALRTFDPDGTNQAFERMVLVGHSMGGLLVKVMVQDSKTRLWEFFSTLPFEKLSGPPEDRELARQVLFFEPEPGVRRVVFIATPHRGSHLDHGALHLLGRRLVRVDDPLRRSFDRLVASNGREHLSPTFRNGLPSSVDQLKWEHPELMTLDALGVSPTVKLHSVIADERTPPRPGGTDGIVPYASSHLEVATSEALVHGTHLCQDNPRVIAELKRILAEHLRP
jgi:pimeloyl-ACP methyl ester carboxylesterase